MSVDRRYASSAASGSDDSISSANTYHSVAVRSSAADSDTSATEVMRSVVAVASHAAEDSNVARGGSLFPSESGRQRTESVSDVSASCLLGQLERGLHVVNTRDLIRVGSMTQ